MATESAKIDSNGGVAAPFHAPSNATAIKSSTIEFRLKTRADPNANAERSPSAAAPLSTESRRQRGWSAAHPAGNAATSCATPTAPWSHPTARFDSVTSHK